MVSSIFSLMFQEQNALLSSRLELVLAKAEEEKSETRERIER